MATAACKPKLPPPCEPDEHAAKTFRLVVQPELMNLDNEGNPRTTIVMLYQLKGGRTLDVMDFDTVFETPTEFFGDEYLAEKEIPVYTDRPEVIEVEAHPEATHAVAVALFREPAGNTWYREWDVPLFHGHSVCAVKDKNAANAAKKPKKQKEPLPEVPDPCFYLTIEGSVLDGGHTPPSAFDPEKFEALPECPPKPLKVKPKETAPKKKKKKKKRDLKGDAEKTKDGGEKAQGGADATKGGADKAGSAGDKVGGN